MEVLAATQTVIWQGPVVVVVVVAIRLMLAREETEDYTAAVEAVEAETKTA